MSELEASTHVSNGLVAVPDYLQRLLEQIAGREGFTDYTINAQPGANIGDGFQGIMLSVVIGDTRNSNSNKELALICKVPPLSELRRQLTANSFKQEIYAYDFILPEIVKFQREKRISDDEGFYSFPKCYGTYSNVQTLEFAIVLEDLRAIGYRMWDKYKSIDFNHVQMAVAQLGKFHAISFALRQQKPELFEKIKQMESSLMKSICDFPPTMDFFKKSYETAIKSLNENDTEERRKMTFLKDNLIESIHRVVPGKLAEPYAVLCHGDFWNNNMMFHYASDDSMVPDKICLIDWQLGQYCSPATDLCYYIYSSTEQPLRTKHFDDILKCYYDSLAKLLKRTGGDTDKQFPFVEFQNQMRKFGMYAMLMAPLLVQVVTVKPEDLPDMDSLTLDNPEDFDLMKNGNAVGYDVRMSDVIRDLVGRGFFEDAHLEGTSE